MFDRRTRRTGLLALPVAACVALLAGCPAAETTTNAAPSGDGAVTPPVTTPVTPPVTTPVTPPVTTPVTPAPVDTTPPIITTPVTSLPTITTLTNVRVKQNGSSATITFDSVDNAKDYRVYPLPSSDNIRVSSDGTVIIPNAIYRCAGTYQVPRSDETTQTTGLVTRVTSAINGYTRSVGEATLGYVYTSATAASGLVPVYALGNPNVRADDHYFYRYQASREKKYTTSATEYAQLVASGWRDDGIAFYVPGTASASTKAVLSNANYDDPNYGPRYYLTQGAELNSRSASLGFATAFNVLTSAAPGSRPLMRVYYQPYGAHPHDELAVGQADFNRIRYQGLDNPATVLHYSGITASTTLVVEALDKGCPFQGTIASQAAAAETFNFQTYSVTHAPWYKISDLQATASDGEVYINGQHDGVIGKPKAIARSFVTLSPQAREQMDWVSTPASFSETFTPAVCGAPDGNCFQQFHLVSNTYDVSFMATETNHWKVGNVQGEFLVTYADWAADTNGKFRMTVRNRKATIASNSFVHATMEVNAVGSGRRYPQLILSDRDIPVQYDLANGRTLILQTFGDFPSRVDLEICDHVTWDVNLQCPRFMFRPKFNSSGSVVGINPIPEADVFTSAVDASTRFDLYASTTRAYIFLNGKPYGCANLANSTGVSPAPVPPSGAVTVTFGDVLYHSDADDNFSIKMKGGFINRHQMNYTSRHFDNLGFSSGVAAPAWDETKLPCTSIMTASDTDPGP